MDFHKAAREMSDDQLRRAIAALTDGSLPRGPEQSIALRAYRGEMARREIR